MHVQAFQACGSVHRIAHCGVVEAIEVTEVSDYGLACVDTNPGVPEFDFLGYPGCAVIVHKPVSIAAVPSRLLPVSKTRQSSNKSWIIYINTE